MIFNKKQVDFLKKEFGLEFEPDVNVALTFKDWIKITDDTFEIEADELLTAGKNNPLSERGEIAVSIIDMDYEK